MHYTISYSGLKGDTKRQKAIQDCKDFLGADRYNTITKNLKEYLGTDPTWKTLRFAINTVENLTGISGYPARALVYHTLRAQ